MNREIKFIYTCVRENGYAFSSKIFTLEDIECGSAEYWIKANHAESSNIYKRQYIGRQDKNGKGIYEGDVCIKRTGVGYTSKFYNSFADGTQKEVYIIVKWDFDALGFISLSKANDPNFIVEIEVIGNIYDNPELLNP